MNITRKTGLLLCILFFLTGSTAVAKPTSGPLRIHRDNPRYFADDSDRAILLAGSHTWNNLLDMEQTNPPAVFDYDAYLDWLEAYGHNFFRLWAWELLSWKTRSTRKRESALYFVSPQPWKRTGPGNALDGKPRFNLQQFNDEYFERLRERVQSAEDRGIYVGVMLFEGWGIQFSPGAWKQHPFHPNNNVNDLKSDLNDNSRGLEIHTGRSLKITELQRAYVRKVIDTVNEFDNVLYEISNETHPASTEWQYGMIRFIKKYEATKPKQHPVGMTFQHKDGSNKTLFDSPADWISPNKEGGYRNNPPAADGSKVIISDTDHLWGIGGNTSWIWKSFLRGLNPIFMDPYNGSVLHEGFNSKWIESIRKGLGDVLKWSRRVNLVSMTPHNDLASSKYCLANPGIEYLAYLPADDEILTLSLQAGQYLSAWFNTVTREESKGEIFLHPGGERNFTKPFRKGTLLYIHTVQ